MNFKTNAIYCGDCKDVLAQFPEGSVDLIYVDPPFFSNRQYEVLWGDGYELRAFEDRWKGGLEHYITWMTGKIRECHRVLKDMGSMYLHCDWHANAHLRILMDRIFGENNFRNEIIWRYRRWTAVSKMFQRMHDTILFYTKTSDYLFNKQYEPFSEKTQIARYKRKVVGGRSVQDKTNPMTRDVKQGVSMHDVWDIPFIHPVSKERLGYPTQKPEALLERIINASSNPTDIILDPMCGCGTATAVAHKLGRQWVGIDVSPTACKLMVNRMRSLGVSIGDKDIVGLPRTLEEIKAMKPFEFQNWVCEKIWAHISRKLTNDKGVDGWLIDGRPLQVKQSENVGRNVIDNFETAIRREKKKRGVVVAFSFGKGSYEEVARAKLHDDLDIELKTVGDIL